MTVDEAKVLKIGDRVEVRKLGGWRLCIVLDSVSESPIWRIHGRVRIRPYGFTKKGYHYGSLSALPHTIRHPVNLPPIPANIYADWLDEHGEHRAAQKLRDAFPMNTQ